jgi:hypothetical protein
LSLGARRLDRHLAKILLKLYNRLIGLYSFNRVRVEFLRKRIISASFSK